MTTNPIKPCGFDKCSIETQVNNDTPHIRDFCLYEEQKWHLRQLKECIAIDPTKRLWVDGKTFANLRVVRSDEDKIIVRLIGQAQMPMGNIRLTAKPYMEGVLIGIETDFTLCAAMASEDVTLMVSFPRSYEFTSLILTGKTVISDTALTVAHCAAFSALYDIRFEVRCLDFKGTSSNGNIIGTLVGQGSSHVLLKTERGDIDVKLDGYNVCDVSISGAVVNKLFEETETQGEFANRLLGTIRADSGSVTVR